MAAELAESTDRLPGAMEAAGGGAPETVVHSVREAGTADELSPEERAVQGLDTEEAAPTAETEADEAAAEALAEGRIPPPQTEAKSEV
jgi:hypothetical protein